MSTAAASANATTTTSPTHALGGTSACVEATKLTEGTSSDCDHYYNVRWSPVDPLECDGHHCRIPYDLIVTNTASNQSYIRIFDDAFVAANMKQDHTIFRAVDGLADLPIIRDLVAAGDFTITYSINRVTVHFTARAQVYKQTIVDSLDVVCERLTSEVSPQNTAHLLAKIKRLEGEIARLNAQIDKLEDDL